MSNIYAILSVKRVMARFLIIKNFELRKFDGEYLFERKRDMN